MSRIEVRADGQVPKGFTALDRHFAALLMRLADAPSAGLELAAQLASRWRAKGHLCVKLSELHENPPDELEGILLPAPAAWADELLRSGVVGAPGDFTPLVLDEKTRLYLWRYWQYEKTLAEHILARLDSEPPEVDRTQLDADLTRLFPVSVDDQTDWQRVAAEAAVTGNFCVISGGPGTGKTRTIGSILSLLIGQGATRFALAAPTGKAAARLKESLRGTRARRDCDDPATSLFPDDVTTLHRLLGARPNRTTFFRNRENPLEVDAVVVDEASMVDVPLMAKLFEATPPGARIILLGDRNQLASVEAGQALGDICGNGIAAEGANPMAHSIVELRRNYRFPVESGIAKLSEAVNAGDANAALDILGESRSDNLRWKQLPSARRLEAELRPAVVDGYRRFLEAGSPAEALARFDEFRILCAVRVGPVGVNSMNILIEGILQAENLIDPRERLYPGRPLMVTRNDHSLKLYNGDTGLLLPDVETGGELRAFFASNGELRRFLPARLPAHETVFAMTVHKSQGSEFREVLLVLPNADSPVLTRELIYTGLTRAREKLELWAGETTLRTAIGRRVQRSSGLREAVWR